MSLETETSNIIAMNSFRASIIESDDPLEVLLREANIPDDLDEADVIESLPTNDGLEALALLSMSEAELALHLDNRIAGLREGISRLKFYLSDVHEAINGL